MADVKTATLPSPFAIHIFVCTNSRTATGSDRERKSCGPLGGEKLRSDLKDWIKKEGLSTPRCRIRVNSSGCLDFCEQGVAVAAYPQGEFVLKATPGSLEEIKQKVRGWVDELTR